MSPHHQKDRLRPRPFSLCVALSVASVPTSSSIPPPPRSLLSHRNPFQLPRPRLHSSARAHPARASHQTHQFISCARDHPDPRSRRQTHPNQAARHLLQRPWRKLPNLQHRRSPPRRHARPTKPKRFKIRFGKSARQRRCDAPHTDRARRFSAAAPPTVSRSV